ncbi:hypothetical protein Kpho02_73120 [Kitasatospora phosalacinea]|uniref:Uncharacterized protein n=1 Tax=Kitasatospora phosalacinea TaxID=2065 RepID=A0A9W6QD81_9ACTN|nr:hypothetical protein [Kitasatospora phosalacinea]GLW75015.1 hypothetical protein Kpho02_73120 [Kitasatospora phosalacinea]
MTHPSPHPASRRPGLGAGLTALLPTGESSGSAGHRAAEQLLLLREAAVPVPVLTAAVELLGLLADSKDTVTREAAAATVVRLRAAAEAASDR